MISSQIIEENNILQDGTLIDLCGATLLWRSAQGLTAAPVSLVSLVTVVSKIINNFVQILYAVVYMYLVIEENSILQDGTLIDLCGAMLLWRSAQGLTAALVSLV